MLKRIKTFFYRGSVINALEVVEDSGSLTYNLIKTKFFKGELDIIDTQSSKAIEDIQDKISDKEPVHLIVNTSSVLVKIIAESASSPEALVNNAFPNIDFSKFNFEIFKQEASSIVCVCRQSVITDLVGELHSRKVPVSSISIGISKISAVAKILDKREVQISTYSLGLSETNEVISKNANKDTQAMDYTIEDVEVSSNCILGFSCILNSLGGPSEIFTNFKEINSALKNKLFNKRFFHYTLRGIIGFLLVLLLANFFVFNHYYSKNSELNPSYSDIPTDAEQLNRIKALVGQKESQVKTLYNSSTSKVSLIFDDIASSIPGDMNLSLMSFQPYTGSIRNDRAINYSMKNLVIEGLTSKREDFNMWVNILESKEYTETVEILNFSYFDNEVSKFTIKIMLKDETQ